MSVAIFNTLASGTGPFGNGGRALFRDTSAWKLNVFKYRIDIKIIVEEHNQFFIMASLISNLCIFFKFKFYSSPSVDAEAQSVTVNATGCGFHPYEIFI